MTSDGGEASRALMVQLLHQLIDIRTRATVARGLFDYTCRNNRSDPNTGHVTPMSLDVTEKAMDQAIDQVTNWLKAQVIALYDPHATTERLREQRPHIYD